MEYIEHSDLGDITLLKPKGEMTFFYLKGLDVFLKNKISEGKYKFIFDMKKVKWIDSMALGLLAMTVKKALFHNSRVCMVHANENIFELLRLSSLIELIKIFPSTDDAVEFLK